MEFQPGSTVKFLVDDNNNLKLQSYAVDPNFFDQRNQGGNGNEQENGGNNDNQQDGGCGDGQNDGANGGDQDPAKQEQNGSQNPHYRIGQLEAENKELKRRMDAICGQ